MCPIDGFSNRVRLERLGKIRLGVRVPGTRDPSRTFPKATEYFVCPPEVLEALKDPQPTSIYPIMFPTDNPDDWMSQWYICYSMTYGVVCRGDGRTAQQRTDLATGAIVNRNTQEGNWQWKDVTCEGEDCPMFQKKQCRPIMRLQFLIPEVPGLGVWELCTSSRNSRLNIQSTIHLVRSMAQGHIKMIPLTLSLEPQEVTPTGATKKTVRIVHLKHNLKLADFLRMAATPLAEQFQLASPVSQISPEGEDLPEDLQTPLEEGEDPPPAAARPATSATAPAKKADTKKPATDTKKAAGDTKKAAGRTATETYSIPIKELDVTTLVDNLFGSEGWDTVAVPLMKEMFGTDSFEKLMPDETHKCWAALKAKFAKASMTNPDTAPAAKKETPKAVATPAKTKDPPHIVALRRKLQTILMEKGMTLEQCVEWLKAHCNGRTTSEGMTQQELEAAIGQASASEGDTAPLF